MKRSRKPLVALVAVALLAAACGGDSDDAGDTGNGGGGDGGGIVIGGDLELPDDFPSDFYIPDSVTLRSFTGSADSPTMALSGRYEGDPADVLADAASGLQAASYELLTQDDDIVVFIRDGLGRIRIRAREFLGEPTFTVDVDNWTDEQIAELRALFAEEVITSGSATATYGGETISANGECTAMGESRSFLAEDVSIVLQLDANLPNGIYADITTSDGIVYTIDNDSLASTAILPGAFSASGQMVEFNNEDAGTIEFAIDVSCGT